MVTNTIVGLGKPFVDACGIFWMDTPVDIKTKKWNTWVNIACTHHVFPSIRDSISLYPCQLFVATSGGNILLRESHALFFKATPLHRSIGCPFFSKNMIDFHGGDSWTPIIVIHEGSVWWNNITMENHHLKLLNGKKKTLFYGHCPVRKLLNYLRVAIVLFRSGCQQSRRIYLKTDW